jgi:ABC-2 type transport system ATP-binding protein
VTVTTSVLPTAAGSRAGPPLIEARGLTKRYGTFVAVDRLSLTVRPGEIFGLLGPNGAGKTTTILMLLGLTEPSGGKARVLGMDPVRQPLEVKRRVGYLPDAVDFYDRMSARENLRYTARLNGIGGLEADRVIDGLLDQVGLADAAHKRAGTFSRGMLQRLGIADALVKEPSLLILDEPTMAIDPAGVAEILELITGLVHDRGIGVLLSTHLLAQVEGICNRVGLFLGGRLVEVGTVRELASRAGDRSMSLDETYRKLVASRAKPGRKADDGHAS